MKTIAVYGSSRHPCQDFAALLPATRGSLPPPGPPLAIFSVAGEDMFCFCRCNKTDINDPFLVNEPARCWSGTTIITTRRPHL
jgi:hypothetical protein